METMIEGLTRIIDSVGIAALSRKKLLNTEFKKALGDEAELPPESLKWFRSRKNSDIKDALALEGIKRGLSVRAQKTMGALPEYCDTCDQKENFNRFDLSWEKTKNSKDFILAVEIEMDLNIPSVIKDFHKLVKNKSDCLKLMICQVRYESDIEPLVTAAKNLIMNNTSQTGCYLLSIWVWERGEFSHCKL